MRSISFRGIKDVEIFGFSARRSAKVIFYLSILGSAYFGLSLIWSVAGLALWPVTFVLGLGWGALGFLFAPIKIIFSVAAVGGLLYGSYKFLSRFLG